MSKTLVNVALMPFLGMKHMCRGRDIGGAAVEDGLLIEWNDDWRVGHTAIDYDHQMLVNITNQLWDLKDMSSVEPAEVKRILDQLVDYVKRHFAREEAIFLASDYPHKDSHVAMHRDLAKVVEDIAAVYERDPDLLDLDEIMDFLKRWLMEHIATHDMGYRPYVGAAATVD